MFGASRKNATTSSSSSSLDLRSEYESILLSAVRSFEEPPPFFLPLLSLSLSLSCRLRTISVEPATFLHPLEDVCNHAVVEFIRIFLFLVQIKY